MKNSKEMRTKFLLEANKALRTLNSLTRHFNKLGNVITKVNPQLSRQLKIYKLQTTIMAKLNNLGIKNNKIKKMSYSQLLKYNAALDRKNKLTLKSTNFLKQNRGALMGIGFAMLFGGMAIERFTKSALKDWINAYDEAMGKTSAFHIMTNRLTGAWTFFKFKLIDALMQSGLFNIMIEFAIKLLNFLSSLPEPVLKLIPLLFAAGVILGAIAMIAGQVGLAILSWKMLGGESIGALSLKGSWLGTVFIGYFKNIGSNAKILFGGIVNYLSKSLKSIKTILMSNKLFFIWFTNIGKWGKTTFKFLNKSFMTSLGNMLIGMAVMAVMWNSLFKGMNDSMGGWLGKGIYNFITYFQAALSYLGGLWHRFVNWIKGKNNSGAYIENGMLKMGSSSDLHKTFSETLKSIREENKAMGGSVAENFANVMSETAETMLGATEGFILGGVGGAAVGAGLELNQFFKENKLNSEIGGLGSYGSLNLQSDALSVGKDNTTLEDLNFENNKSLDDIKDINESQLDETKETNTILTKMNNTNETIANALGGTLNQFKDIVSSTLN